MIRINLATAGAFTPTSNAAVVGGEGVGLLSRDEMIKAIASRLFFILLFPALLYSYELYSLPKLRLIVEQKEAELAEATAKNEKASQILDELKKTDAAENLIRSKLDKIENIRKTQLSEVRGMDAIQRLIPSRVWLQSLDINNRKVKISGYAQLDSDLGSFIDSLTKSVFIKDVSLVKSTAITDQKSGIALKQFDLTASLEVIK